MSGQELYEQLSKYTSLLDRALKEFSKRGELYSTTERNYRVELAKKILSEREKGTPVTIISDICRGDENIANLKLERDLSEGLYKSSLEAIQVYKTQIRVLENTIEREYKS